MKIVRNFAFLAFVLAASALWSQQDDKPLYLNPNAPVPNRVHDLLSRMNIDEKIAQLQSRSFPSAGLRMPSCFERYFLRKFINHALLRDGLGTFAYVDEFLGVSLGGPRDGAIRRNLLQDWVVHHSRLGIPIMFHGEALHGAVTNGGTLFPQAVGLGSTWDPDLLKTMFEAVAQESRASGNSLVLAPVLDPNVGPNDFSERTMREFFLYPFQQVVEKGHVGAVMPSYNENDGGIPSHANPWLLKQVLREEWGFTGITISDYTAVEQLYTLQHVAADDQAAGVLALNSGVDMELPTPSGYDYANLEGAVKTGKVSQKAIDDAVGRVLTIKFRAGIFEHPYADPDRAAEIVGSKAHGELARKVADEAIVLLKNENNTLPLDPGKIMTLSVIGPNADKKREGTYSSIPPYFVTVLDGIRRRVGDGTKVVYAEGCRISKHDSNPKSNAINPYRAPDEGADQKLIKKAVDVASSADVVVLVLGGNEVVSRESFGNTMPGLPESYGDSDTLELPGMQNELVREIAKLGKPMVAVLLNGKAYSIEELTKHVPGILEGWYLGQETGNAISDVLFGDVNPSGHLPVTIARNVGQLPVYYYKTPAARRGYVFDKNTPLFPFGFGLSYTTFKLGKPTLDQEQISANGKTQVHIIITNSGNRSGDQVVQLYVHHPVSSVVQPEIILRGFKRVHFEPGASMSVSFDVGPEQLSILDAQMKYVVEPGPVDILLGSSSVDTSPAHLTITD